MGETLSLKSVQDQSFVNNASSILDQYVINFLNECRTYNEKTKKRIKNKLEVTHVVNTNIRRFDKAFLCIFESKSW